MRGRQATGWLRLRPLLLGLVAASYLAVPFLSTGAPPLLLNTSCSVPCGLYLRRARPPRRGDLVAACLPGEVGTFARRRGYVAAGRRCPDGQAPVLKRLAATAGTRVELRQGVLALDGRPVPGCALRQADSAGRPLPALRRVPYEVPPGHVLLLADHPFSFDGRYFGPVAESQLLAAYRPLWTWSH